MGLKSFFSGKPGRTAEYEPEPKTARLAPHQPLFVVGDLHGRADLLELMLGAIDQVIGVENVRNPVLFFVGNMVDHGLSSRAVLLRMKELTAEFPKNVVCLMGNHERMLLDFLQAPSARLPRWRREGGDATCRSFGLDPEGEPDALASELRKALGVNLLDWLERLPLSQRSGNLFIVHAGADPARPIDDQTDRVKIWGHPEFLTRPRVDGHWVAHGHHVVEEAHAKDGRISVNAAGWQSGLLSCAYVPLNGDVRFLQVSDNG